jgi:chromosome segregation ATPase
MMTDNDAINALEWMKDCKDEKISNCDGCPLLKHYPYCDELSVEIALDLINRQKEQIKQKDTEIDILIRKKEALKDELAEKQAEIEGYKESNREYAEMLAEQETEVERLKNECFCLANERDAYKDVLDTAVIEARKEFAERLKEKAYRNNYCQDVVLKDDIDNLLTEMESERE